MAKKKIKAEAQAAPEPEAAFVLGTTVKLVSGGPAMTVAAVDGDEVLCLWFAGDDLADAIIPASALAAA